VSRGVVQHHQHRLLLTGNVLVTHLEFAMNIELDEVVVQDVSDDELELAAVGQG